MLLVQHERTTAVVILNRHQRTLHHCPMVVAVLAAARGVEASRRRVLLVVLVHDYPVIGGRLLGTGAESVNTAPEKGRGNDQEEDAAGQPHAHRQLPARPVVRVTAVAQSVENLTLLSDRVGCLAGHTQEVGGLRVKVGQVRAGLAHRDALFVHEAFPFVSHEEAVPVGVVHDAVESVQAVRRPGPAHFSRGGRDVVDYDAHNAMLLELLCNGLMNS